MNENPEREFSETFVVCVNDKGKFLKEESDGQATWLSWTDNLLLADRFGEYFVYGERQLGQPHDPMYGELKDPSWYKKWPEIPAGCRMMWCKVNVTAWLRSSKFNAKT